MFAKLVVQFATLATMASSVIAGPLALRPKYELATRTFSGFNNWGGFASLSNFDNFYGADNFDGSHYNQVVVSHDQLVCHTQQKWQKGKIEAQINGKILEPFTESSLYRIITEHICDVETQTIVFEQWHSGLHGFSRDLRRHTDHQVGFDSHISSFYNQFFSSDGSLSNHDFGFTGHDLGHETVLVSGHNWDDNRSPASVEDAYRTTRDAYQSVHPELF
ncbi:hypothetical protein H0H87_000470 [Tephrocybe sp. NHM501043]|nr:hypothetical protein H0H87_000470 [Tephrocybe sp. NHM501043]